MKKAIRLMPVCLLLVAVACVLYLRWSVPRPGVTVENFQRLRARMSEEQVERLLGGPGHVWGRVTLRHGTMWRSEECSIDIWFSEIVRIGADEGSCWTGPGEPQFKLAPARDGFFDRWLRW